MMHSYTEFKLFILLQNYLDIVVDDFIIVQIIESCDELPEDDKTVSQLQRTKQ
jgi:hypothetical protein